MAVYLYPMDYTGCGSYRIIWPSEAMPDKKDEIRIIPPGDHGGIQARVVNNTEVKEVVIPDDCDTVVVQRPTLILMVQTLWRLQRAGVRVVVEVDDDLPALSPRHPSWNLLRMPGHSPKAMVEACKFADVVMAPTEQLLKKYAGHGRGVLAPNCLPKSFLSADLRTPLVPGIGWPGAVGTHPDDLAVLGNALTGLKEFPIKIIGPQSDRGFKLLGVEPTYSGSVPFHEWIPAVSSIHTGIAPLEMSPFNQAKSWLKPLELSVAKVPFACSPTQDYLRLGAGLIVRDNKPREWAKQLRRLLTEPGLREHEIGRNYEIAQKWVIDDHVDIWRNVWFP